MDTVKLEAKWPPDRKSTIEASEFGIYKEPNDGKRLRGTDWATGCLLVLSLIAAAAVVLYFTFFDYTMQPTTAQISSGGPIVSGYAKYVKDKRHQQQNQPQQQQNQQHSASEGGGGGGEWTDRPAATADGPGARQFTENHTAAAAKPETIGGRHMRLYRVGAAHRPRGPPANKFLTYDSNYWRTGAAADDGHANDAAAADHGVDVADIDRRSDFPQLAAYRAPFPPKSVLDVMKYVTGQPPVHVLRKHHGQPLHSDMMTQESRYMPIRPAEEVNRFLPDVQNAPAPGSSNRFRNRFGPPVFLTPPVMTRPDDFMKPPNPGARFSMDFVATAPVDLSAELSAAVPMHDGAATAPSHTGVVFHRQLLSPTAAAYPVPDAPAPPKRANNKARSKKPISMMVDIYPLSDGERENVQVEDDEEDLISFKTDAQESDAQNLLWRLNLFPKFSDGGRRMSKGTKKVERNDQSPIVHLTTSQPLRDDDDEDNDEDERFVENEFMPESKIIAGISKIK